MVAEGHPKAKRSGRMHEMNREVEIWCDWEAENSLYSLGDLIWRNKIWCSRLQSGSILLFCLVSGYESKCFDSKPVILPSVIVVSCSVGGRAVLYGIQPSI